MSRVFNCLRVFTSALLIATACTRVSTVDSELEKRIARLEERCDALNQELSSLSTIVAAMGSGDWVTDVTPVTENGVVTGYVVNFYTHGPITITCGKDGKDGIDGKDGSDGKTPQLGVITLEDGNVYWAIDGDLVKDASGNPVQANGVAPQMKIEEGNWFVSYDSGKSWTYAGPATAIPEGQVVFKDVSVDTQAGTVTFTLNDGSSFSASLKPSVEIVLNADGLEAPIEGGETITIGYTLSGADKNTLVTAASDGNYKVTVKSEGTKGGKILVTAPEEYADGFVNVILSNGRGYTYVKVINFYQRKGSVSGGGHAYEYAVATQSGTVEVPISVNFPYTVKTGASWIEFVGTRAPSMHTDRLQFKVQKNENTYARTGKVYIYPDNNPSEAFLTITFNQASAYFSIDKTQFIAEADGDTFTTTVRTSKDFTVDIPSDASWLTSAVTDKGNGEYAVSLTAAENSGTARRKAEVRLLGNNSSALAKIDVVQFASNEDERDAMIITVRANYANDFTVGLPIRVYEDLLIDWGDGVVEMNPGIYPEHTYKGLDVGTDFDIKITGRVSYMQGNSIPAGERNAIIAVKQWGRLGVRIMEYTFWGCKNLVSLPGDDDYSFENLESVLSVFEHCTGLTSLPDNLFASWSSARSFDYCFRGCTGLTTLPENLFAGCTSASSFHSCFQGCTGLTTLPENLFAGCSSASSFDYCFHGCTGLTTLPENLFAGCTSARSFLECFFGCTGLTTLPENLFAGCSSASSFGGCFKVCTGLTTLPKNLFAGCTSASSFDHCFNGCTGLTTLPDNLFAGCTSASSFNCCFIGCTGLTTLPDNLFAGCQSATSFLGTFGSCIGLKTVPESLFAHCPNALVFDETFYKCTGLLSIPENLFSSCKETRSFSSVFQDCTSLVSIPSNLFDFNRKVDDFRYAFSGCSLTGESPFTVINNNKIHLYERADYPDFFHNPSSHYSCFSGNKSLTDYASIPSDWK